MTMTLRTAVRAVWVYVSSPSVIWWGLPPAVVLAVWMTGRSIGFGWRNLFTVEFLVWLVVSVLIFGVFGGHAVAAHMRRWGIRHQFDRDDDRAP
jgi:hypothetical protein